MLLTKTHDKILKQLAFELYKKVQGNEMEVIRKIVDLEKLKGMIDIPHTFNYSKVEILIMPLLEEGETARKTERFNPKQFFGISSISNVEQAIQEIRGEWDRI